MNNEKLEGLTIAIVVAHTMNRFMKKFQPHERTAAMERMMQKINRFLRKRERSNAGTFVFATEYERILWTNVAHKYKADTPIFGIDFMFKLYEYYQPMLQRYALLPPKLIEKVAIVHNESDLDDDKFLEIEENDGDLISTYVKEFEVHSKIGLRKSKFAVRLQVAKDKVEK